MLPIVVQGDPPDSHDEHQTNLAPRTQGASISGGRAVHSQRCGPCGTHSMEC